MIKQILLYIWQLPQNLFALLLLLINIKSKEKHVDPYVNISYYTVKHLSNAGISLGNYILMDDDRSIVTSHLQHEHGHQIQSLCLGWLYLIIIGLPSLLGNAFDRAFHKNWKPIDRYYWYYSQPWEKWADKLGGVKR